MPKLNVFAIIKHVVSLFANARLLLRICGVWLALVVAIGMAIGALWPSRPPDKPPVVLFALMPLNWALSVLAITACAINVHRYILLNENPTFARLSGLEWRYLWRGIWIYLPIGFVGAMLVAAMGFAFQSGVFEKFGVYPSPLTLGLLWAIFGLGATFFLVQFSLSLPAVAIGHREFRPGSGLDASNRNELRLMLLAVLALAVPWLIEQALTAGVIFLMRGLPAAVTSIAGFTLSMAFALLQAIAWAAMLSYAYAGLVQRNPDFVLLVPPSGP